MGLAVAPSFARHALLLGARRRPRPGNPARLGPRHFGGARRTRRGARRRSGYAQAAAPVGRAEPGTAAAALRRNFQPPAPRLLREFLSRGLAGAPAPPPKRGVASPGRSPPPPPPPPP